jgi:hypothetical protein
LGLTLIACYNGYGANGKLWEQDREGKIRWEIKDAKGPIDAQVLPGNRVLVAENTGSRVCERSFDGKILWELGVENNQRPVSCQRLPNGNTLLATNETVYEVNADKKKVATYAQNFGGGKNITGARKLANGNVAFVHDRIGTLVIVDAKGNEIKKTELGGQMQGWVSIELLPADHFLVTCDSESRVLEFDKDGKKVKELNMPVKCTCAGKAGGGNVVICSLNDRKIMEVNREGKPVWEHKVEGSVYFVKYR